MTKIPIYQVDAFTDKLFGGNPAAICPLTSWLPDDVMQAIAMQNNLAETAFFVTEGDRYIIRWFTPTVEVDLCGHATLATAHVLFDVLGHKFPEIDFSSPRSGKLRVFRSDGMLYLDFPTDTLRPSNNDGLEQLLGSRVVETYRGKSDLIAILENEKSVRSLKPDFKAISKLPARGLIVTAQGDDVDFVSRFFAPQSGIDEDPVTGSAHTSLIPLWSGKLGKKDMTARQLSQRGGYLVCSHQGNRCHIGGKAKLYLKGEICIE